MTLEEKSFQIKQKKKQVKKTLPKNVFEIVGESGQLVERVDSNKTEKKVKKSPETEPKPTFSERTTKRRVNKKTYSQILFYQIYFLKETRME
jgi:hypothetical protein